MFIPTPSHYAAQHLDYRACRQQAAAGVRSTKGNRNKILERRCSKGTAAAHTAKQADAFPEDHTQHHTQAKPGKNKRHKSAETPADLAPSCTPKLTTIDAVRNPNRDPAVTLHRFVAMPTVLTAADALTACLYSGKDRAHNPL